MGAVLKSTMVYLGVNIFLYIYMVLLGMSGHGGILPSFLEVNPNGVSLEGTVIYDALPTDLATDSAVVGVDTLDIPSPLRMIWDVFVALLTLAAGPVMVAVMIDGIPWFAVALLALPGVITIVLGLMAYLRGSDL